MSEDIEKRVPLRVPESLHAPARVKIARLDTSFQAVLVELLRKWTFDEQAKAPVVAQTRSADAELLAKVEAILAAGGQNRDTLKSMINLAYRDLQAQQPAATPAANVKKAG